MEKIKMTDSVKVAKKKLQKAKAADIKSKPKPKKKAPVKRKPRKKTYVFKNDFAKTFMPKKKERNWSNLEELHVEMAKFIDNSFEEMTYQVGFGKNAYFETRMFLVFTIKEFRNHLGVNDNNIGDWFRRDNEVNKSYAKAITHNEQRCAAKIMEQSQLLQNKAYTDAAKWLLAATFKVYDRESTKDKVKAMQDIKKAQDFEDIDDEKVDLAKQLSDALDQKIMDKVITDE